MRLGVAIVAGNFAWAGHASAATVLYPAPAGASLSSDFSLKVNGQAVSVYRGNGQSGQSHAFAYFDFSGAVTIEVTMNSPWMTTPVIRPVSKGITYASNGKVITFSLSNPANLSIEPSNTGVIDAIPLLLFANPLEVNPPRQGDPGVIYYGPGIHTLSAPLSVPSNNTLYIAGGAILRGQVYTIGSSNISIRGRGVLDGLGQNAPSNNKPVLHIRNCTNVTVEGIIVKDSPAWTFYITGTSYLTATNVKIISAVGPIHHDGIDIDNSDHVTIQDSFVLSDDDSFQIGGQHWLNTVPMDTVNVTRTVLWTGANNWRIAWVAQTPYISNLTFTDIDVIHRNGYTHVVTVQASGDGTVGTPVTNIRFENIRVEADYSWTGAFIELQPMVWGNDGAMGPTGSIRNVYFKNISLTGYQNPNSPGTIDVLGPSAASFVRDVTFENVMRYGQLTLASSPNVNVGANTNNIVFFGNGTLPPPAPPPPPPPTGLPDVIVTAVSYADGTFSATVKNQGAAATPTGVFVGVAYYVDGTYKAGAYVPGPLGVGASVSILSAGGVVVPDGTHSLMAFADDVNRFAESDEANNKLFQTITVGAVLNPTDLNGDGTTNISDVQLGINQALGLTACGNGDLNGDGSCNVIDVQQIVNKALGR